MFSLFYRWSYDDCVTEASISQDIAPLKFPLKVHNWSHVVISVQAGQEGDVSGGKVSDTVLLHLCDCGSTPAKCRVLPVSLYQTLQVFFWPANRRL